MARLLADEDFDARIVHALRRLGHDVLTLPEAGLANQRTPDDAVLQSATDQERAVLTHNRKDFVYLHPRHPGHGGILAASRDPDAEGAAARIDATIQAEEPLAGKLFRINRLAAP
jgi:hypothetical protein